MFIHHAQSITPFFNFQHTTTMKKNLLLLVIATFALTLHAHQIIDLRTGQIVDNIQPLPPEKTVEKCENGLIVTYKFTHAILEQDTVYQGTSMIHLPGFDIEDRAGFPSISKGLDTYFVPLNSNPKVVVTKKDYISLNYKLAPARKTVRHVNFRMRKTCRNCMSRKRAT